MRFLFNLLLMVAVALAVGFGLSYYALTDGRAFAASQSGPWLAWPEVGSVTPDPYTRAYLARRGTMQLGRSEGIQFVAQTDSSGLALSANCTYRIDGPTPVATFWTLAAVDENGVNIAVSNDLLFLDSMHVARHDDGTAIIRVGSHLSAGNWLEISGDGTFELQFTLYDTVIFSGIGTEFSAMPSIVQERCT